MRIVPSGKILGATIEDIDLAKPVTSRMSGQILKALGEHGVLRFPHQRLETEAFARFGALFGDLEINVANQFHEPGFPQVMVLSNMARDGKPVGLGDAGQGWHTDMSYSRQVALANVLHAIKVPVRDGQPLGDTQFRNMEAAYQDLPADIKKRLEGRTATHDFAKFWDMMRARSGSQRGALSPEQRAKKPPVAQPIFRVHPITGRKILYCNPGYAVRIDGLSETERQRSSRSPLHPSGPGEVFLCPPVDRGRRRDVGQYRHHPQRGARLSSRRAALYAAGPGDGDQGLCAPGRLRRA